MTKVLIPLWFIHWKLENRKLPWSLPFQGQLHENKHFHIEGRYYWLTKNQCIITFDVEEELSGVMMAPGPMMRDGGQTSACLGDSDGYISSFRMCWWAGTEPRVQVKGAKYKKLVANPCDAREMYWVQYII